MKDHSALALDSGSRVGVIGGGPAGSFFSYFLLDMAQRVDMDVHVDIYESRDFSQPGPAGCNMCGGIIAESLVQTLAAEGINLPPTVVERGIDSYVLHMDAGNVRIETPLHEMRIAAVHRGAGPKGRKEMKWRSFDGYLLELAVGKGAHLIPGRVDDIGWNDSRPQVKTKDGSPHDYDLLVVAMGVNTGALKLFEGLEVGYKPPQTTKTYIGELYLGQEIMQRYMGSSIHLFLPKMPRLDFACLIPKGEFATLCLMGQDIDQHLVQSLMDTPEVRECLPANWSMPQDFCHCSPRMNTQGAVQPFADRIVFIGDSGVTRLNKDGIGAAYRTAKAAAVTAIFDGISAEDFRRHYWSVCQAIKRDNRFGKMIFAFTHQIQRRRFLRRGVLRTVSREQEAEGGSMRLSMVFWDTFTGSAHYRDVFLRTLHPSFLGRFLWDIAAGFWPLNRDS